MGRRSQVSAGEGRDRIKTRCIRVILGSKKWGEISKEKSGGIDVSDGTY